VDPGQLAARVNAEVLGQPFPGVVEHVQRLGLPPAPVQRDHQQAARPLPQRVLSHQHGEAGHRLGGQALGEQQVGTLLGGRCAQFAEPLTFRLGERAGYPGEREPAPQRQRLVHRLHGARQVAGGAQAASPAKALFEVVGVEAARIEPEHVPAARGHKHARGRAPCPLRAMPPPRRAPGRAARPVRLQDAPQPRHVGVDPALRACRRAVPPDRVDEFAS